MRISTTTLIASCIMLLIGLPMTSTASGEHDTYKTAAVDEQNSQHDHDHHDHGHSSHNDSENAGATSTRTTYSTPGADYHGSEQDSQHHDDAGEPTVEKTTLTGEEVLSGHDHEHDHATGHGSPTGLPRVMQFMGKFHPLLVHFPIALILMAVLAEILSAVIPRQQLFSGAARFCIVTGAGGAIAAAILGWTAGAFAVYPDDLATVLFRHRWLGVSTAILSSITALLGELKLKYNQQKLITAYRVCLIVCAVVVGVTGHFGATLVYGLEYFSW